MIPVFIVDVLGAYCTYNKNVRESWVFLPAIVFLFVMSGLLWFVSARQFDSTAELLFFSLIWDILMVLAYYAGPLIFKGTGFGWQAYAAAALTVAGIFWFKLATTSSD
jgi:hypothetical protein